MPLSCLLLATLFTALPVGSEVQFSGSLRPEQDERGEQTQSFLLTVLLTEPQQIDFVVEPRGRDAGNWPDRFGRYDVAVRKGDPIRLAYQRKEGRALIPVQPPLMPDSPRWQPGEEWMEGQATFRCRDIVEKQNVRTAILEVSLPRGRRQELVVETATGLMVSLRERLFLGQGEPYELTYQRLESRQLEAEERAKTGQVMEQLLDLRNQLGGAATESPLPLNGDQVALIQKTLAALPALPASAWGRLVSHMERDTSLLTRRQQSLQDLAAAHVGQPAPLPASWTLIDGTTLSAESLRGKVTVLHFWSYRDEPLVEPYGQVGYLDFLRQRRSRAPVQIIGIAVPANEEEATRRTAWERSVQKFRQFMNVGYPIALDPGKLQAAFGDPRTLGAELPLWVVVDAAGKIVHYHVGHYDVKPDEGLKELDQAVTSALKSASRPTP